MTHIRARRLILNAALATMLMFVMVALTEAITPRMRLVDQIGLLDLETAIPEQFGDWRIDRGQIAVVVNPQQADLLDRIYSQTLSRTYVNSVGQRIMLSVAYGEDQRDGMSLHYPEVCYPAQGFLVASQRRVMLSTRFGQIRARQLEMIAGQRHEPVTYWTTIGTHQSLGGMDKKLAEMRYGLKGVVPDGLLFRVSSIGRDTHVSYQLQQQFIGAVLDALAPEVRQRMSGI